MHLSPVASDSVWWWWWWWWCIWYAVFNLFLTHMRPMSVCFVCACVFARSFWWSLYICTDQEKQTNLEKNTEEFVDSRSLSLTLWPLACRWKGVDSCSQMLSIIQREMFVGNDDTIWFIRFVVLSFFLSFVRSRLARSRRGKGKEREKEGWCEPTWPSLFAIDVIGVECVYSIKNVFACPGYIWTSWFALVRCHSISRRWYQSMQQLASLNHPSIDRHID